MKRISDFSRNDSKKIRNDDDFLFQGNEEDEDLIAHLVDIEPVVMQQTQTIPNPPIADEQDEFSDDLDDAAFKELQVQESEFLRQTQIMEISPPNSYRDLPGMDRIREAFGQSNQNSKWQEDFQKVSYSSCRSVERSILEWN